LSRVGEDSPNTRDLLAHAIPATLRDLAMARRDRMEGHREVAQSAATLGRELSYEFLAAVAIGLGSCWRSGWLTFAPIGMRDEKGRHER
jgi:nitroreductase